MRREQTTSKQSPVGRKAAHRGRRTGLVILITASALVASGWIAYAQPFSWRQAPVGENVQTAIPTFTPAATNVPVPIPTLAPTLAPTVAPTVSPTSHPTARPAPTVAPTSHPTARPTETVAPTSHPTVPQTTFTIGVPVIKQTMHLDCETAALQMGLATYGYYYSQDTLFGRENPDLRAPVMGPNHTVLQWGDPYTNFVGDVNGSDWTPTGYGVYYPVILRMARNIGLTNAYGGEGFSATTIYHALSTGHAVEVWIETNWTRPGVSTWKAWDGRTVRYSYAEHAVTLSGVSPTEVRVNDPLHGTQYWISKATFETSWADFNNMAVVF
jgi:uncharacterized protein YvpB